MKKIIEVEIGFPKSIVQYEGEPITTMISTEQLQEELNLQLLQPDVSGRSEQFCGNLDENYNCKNMCLTRCVDGNKFYK